MMKSVIMEQITDKLVIFVIITVTYPLMTACTVIKHVKDE